MTTQEVQSDVLACGKTHQSIIEKLVETMYSFADPRNYLDLPQVRSIAKDTLRSLMTEPRYIRMTQEWHPD